MTSEEIDKKMGDMLAVMVGSPTESREDFLLSTIYQCTPEQIDDIRHRLKHSTMSDEEFDEMCAVLKTLPWQSREAFLLHTVFGLPCRQIANGMGVSASEVESFVKEGTDLLNTQLKNQTKD